jgi:hypothetical protein
MSLTTFPAAVIETILARLAMIFLAGASGDNSAARQAAQQMLIAYNPQTEDELCLAANIISFNFQALEALGQAANPDQPITRVLRLRSGAVSLSREAEKARRSLSQLQKARQQAQQAEAPQPEPVMPQARHRIPAAAVRTDSEYARAQAEEDRQRDLRIAAALKRHEARLAAASSQAGHSEVTETDALATMLANAAMSGGLPLPDSHPM